MGPGHFACSHSGSMRAAGSGSHLGVVWGVVRGRSAVVWGLAWCVFCGRFRGIQVAEVLQLFCSAFAPFQGHVEVPRKLRSAIRPNFTDVWSMSCEWRVAGSSHGKTSKKHSSRARKSTPEAPWTPPGRLLGPEKARRVASSGQPGRHGAARSSQWKPDRAVQGAQAALAARPRRTRCEGW